MSSNKYIIRFFKFILVCSSSNFIFFCPQKIFFNFNFFALIFVDIYHILFYFLATWKDFQFSLKVVYLFIIGLLFPLFFNFLTFMFLDIFESSFLSSFFNSFLYFSVCLSNSVLFKFLSNSYSTIFANSTILIFFILSN